MTNRYQINSPALLGLAKAAACFDIPVEPAQLQHRLGLQTDKIDSIALCRCASWIGLRARHIKQPINRLPHLPLPALFSTAQGWCLLLTLNDNHACVYFPQIDEQRQISLAQLTDIWQEEVIILARIECEETKKSFGFNWFIPQILKHRSQLRNIILLSLLLQFIALTTPMLFEAVIDKVLVSRGLDSLMVLGIAMLALALAEPSYTFLRSWLFSHLSSKVGAELNSRLYRHLFSLPLSYFTRRKTGETIAQVQEMEQIRHFLTGSALMMLLDLLFIGMFVAVMFYYSSQLTCIVLVSLLCYMVFWLAAGGMLRKRVEAQYRANASATAFLTETITGIETIKTTATENQFNQRWHQRLALYVRAGFRTTQASNLAAQGIALIQKISAALLLWFGVRLALVGELTPGQLVAFNMLAGYATQPILRMAQIWQEFQHTLISLKRIGTILDQPSEPGSSGLASGNETTGSICFKHVRFRYQPDAPEVLQNLNLEIKAGEFIGITGPSGCGKSTLTKLLQRLYTPQNGQILVDGQDLAITDPTALRCRMSVVLQESVLFAGSIADNISQCYPDADISQLEHAARQAGAHDFICDLPQGYQTQVGERGGMLSGGQRQRIALARALLANPQILILDEATSALDYESEAAIMQQLPEITRDRTVICIAHRLNTLRGCHRILLLENGTVNEQGTHSELLAKDGTYARLWHLQTQ